MKHNTEQDPLRLVIREAHMAMGSHNLRHLLESLTTYIQKFGNIINVGTMCSGSDLLFHALEQLSLHWKEEYGFQLDFQHSFACECISERIKFIQAEWGPRQLHHNTKACNIYSLM